MLKKDARFVSSIHTNGPKLKRKPSVTFSEKVDVVQGVTDSIVTDSLLLLTKSAEDGSSVHRAFLVKSEDLEPPGDKHDDRVSSPQQPILKTVRMKDEDIGMEERLCALEEDCEPEGSCGNVNTASSSKRRGSKSKSPFGGIADHYAAAKEIAKEIESYGDVNSSKTARKKSKFLPHNSK